MFENNDWREPLWAALGKQRNVDLLVIGGGIAGAGIFLEAARAGLNVLLVEQGDFASGTSSRSSKMVHGGLRYLAQKRIRLTRDSVRERERLLNEAPGLVEPLDFYFANYNPSKSEQRMFRLGLRIYDHLAGIHSSHSWSAEEMLQRIPGLRSEGMASGFSYQDAGTDDARLVLRTLQEGMSLGGRILNYARVESLVKMDDQRVGGAVIRNLDNDERVTMKAKVVVNATGAWVDDLRGQLGCEKSMRPLRGSHLVLARERLPLDRVAGFLHPDDQRPLFAYPWEGAILIGTTDLDHRESLISEPRITKSEIEYLLQALNHFFPGAGIKRDDVVSGWAGVRPVVDTGEENPSDEPRHHEVWDENGLLTVTGGKLTTFRLTAIEALNKVRKRLPGQPQFDNNSSVFAPAPKLRKKGLSEALARRLSGRFGRLAPEVLAIADAGELAVIPGTETLWVELRWAARHEAVQTLEDLLLRRTRIGWLLPSGAGEFMPRIQQIVQPELGWDESRWQAELTSWEAHWSAYYRLPDSDSSPNDPLTKSREVA